MISRKQGRAALCIALLVLGAGAAVDDALAQTAGADLVVSQTASPQPGGALALAIVVRNAGPSNATAVAVRELFNASGITAISHVSNRSTNCRAVKPPLGYTHARKCQIARLDAGRSWNLTFTVKAPTGTPVSAKANLAASVADSNPANNVASVSSWTGPVADLSVVLGAAVEQSPGFLLQPVSVGNEGPNTEPNAFIKTDDFGKLSGPGCPEPSTWGTACAIGDVAPQEEWQGYLHYSATWGAPQVTVFGQGSFDPNLGNNVVLASGT